MPLFVLKVVKGYREEQYNLVDTFDSLSRKHSELFENDPSKKYKKELREKYSDELKTAVEQEFIQEGRKYNSTDVIKEKKQKIRTNGKRCRIWRQLA